MSGVVFGFSPPAKKKNKKKKRGTRGTGKQVKKSVQLGKVNQTSKSY
jgi:hypothetical protein